MTNFITRVTFIYEFISINIISYSFFLLFIDIPPSTPQAYLSY